MALLTAAQFVFYKDANRIGQYLSDDADGEPVEEAAFAANTTLLEIIRAAEQEVIAAILVGARYTIDEMVVLAADNHGGSVVGGTGFGDGTVTGGTTVLGLGAKLRRLVAALAWGLLVNRRGYAQEEFDRLAPDWKMAQAELEQLRLGERIFPITAVPEAGLPSVVALGQCVKGSITSKSGLFGNLATGGTLYGGPNQEW